MDNIIRSKSFDFAIRIVNLYKYLIEIKKEYVISKQLLRSGTSIGANIEEAIGSYSSKDFLYKVNIAYKEARETRYWIKLLNATEYLNDKETDTLISDIEEICKIIGAIQNTMRTKLKNNGQ